MPPVLLWPSCSSLTRCFEYHVSRASFISYGVTPPVASLPRSNRYLGPCVHRRSGGAAILAISARCSGVISASWYLAKRSANCISVVMRSLHFWVSMSRVNSSRLLASDERKAFLRWSGGWVLMYDVRSMYFSPPKSHLCSRSKSELFGRAPPMPSLGNSALNCLFFRRGSGSDFFAYGSPIDTYELVLKTPRCARSVVRLLFIPAAGQLILS
mmetsp:Transcript_16103/g.42396  ORF Transcript_16103/g.42396 Transcript_16103/m.42396 type:complete len:213 (+) Transcript_16103:557-1195(+)